MKCNNCEAIFPSNYKECPNCKSTDFAAEKFKQDFMFIDEIEPIDPYVVCAEIEIDE